MSTWNIVSTCTQRDFLIELQNAQANTNYMFQTSLWIDIVLYWGNMEESQGLKWTTMLRQIPMSSNFSWVCLTKPTVTKQKKWSTLPELLHMVTLLWAKPRGFSSYLNVSTPTPPAISQLKPLGDQIRLNKRQRSEVHWIYSIMGFSKQRMAHTHTLYLKTSYSIKCDLVMNLLFKRYRIIFLLSS